MKMKSYMKVGFVFAAAAIALAMVSCGTTNAGANGNALNGIFEVRGMPASNPAGLNMDITLNDDFTFELTSWFGDDSQTPVLESGNFAWWDESAGIIELSGLQNDDLRLYQLDNGNLLHLMPNGDRFADDGHTLTRRM